jgi:plasmid stabilization system protein ParE
MTSITLAFDKLSVDLARELLAPSAPSYDLLRDALEESSERLGSSELLIIEMLAGVCQAAADVGVNAEALLRLLPVIHSCAVDGKRAADVQADILALAGALNSDRPELLSFPQAKALTTYVSRHGFLAHHDAYAYALTHGRRSIDVVHVVHTEQPLPVLEDQLLDRAQLLVQQGGPSPPDAVPATTA